MKSVDETAAGPEMDALIVEKVMKAIGLYSNGIVWCDELGSIGYWINDGIRILRGEGGTNFPAFHPSTDPAAAIYIANRITAYHHVALRLVGPMYANSWTFAEGWHATFIEPAYTFTDVGEGGTGETVAVAICRAALKFMEQSE